MRKFLTFLVCALFVGVSSAQEPITLSSLLDEMADRSALARFPDPMYTCKQASSYDRRSTDPTVRTEENWFANHDTAQFLREEINDGRKEWVLMDEKGPGAIVRWWITAPHYRTTIRVYLDGDATPALEADAAQLIGGKYLVDGPLSAEKARGRNLYLPIPYEKSCKVTADLMKTGDKEVEQGNFYYQINYRTYAAGTKVVSFSWDRFRAVKAGADAFGQEETKYEIMRPGYEKRVRIQPGDDFDLEMKDGPGAIAAISIKLEAEDMAQALRSTLLKIEFDDEEDHAGRDETTVYCPVGEFFGSGVGVNPYDSRYGTVRKDGTMLARWVMPYKKEWKVELENEGAQPVDAVVSVSTIPWTWDARSMYFHCNWRRQGKIPGRPIIDWEYVKLAGRGVYVGDVLSVWNGGPAWWGEGDEKIYVDGETFPSHFGTGTEDYYGYAWCSPQVFDAPFHAQPRAEGPRNYGNVTNLRYRALDAIPFTKDFRFDMEVWSWGREALHDYAVATFWYGLPGTRTVGAPNENQVAAEAKQAVVYKSPSLLPKTPGFKLTGLPGGTLRMQDMKAIKEGAWKDDDQLLWSDVRPGDRLDFVVATDLSGPQTLFCAMTKGPGYGKVQFYINWKKVGEPIDLFGEHVEATGEIEIGTFDLPAGEKRMIVEIVGKNEKATGYLFGIDSYRFGP